MTSKISVFSIIKYANNHRIPDPMLDMNELKVHWVGERQWTYKCSFPTPKIDSNSRTAIVFEGLDTFAKVRLNGKEILISDNMFVSHRVDVTEDLQPESFNTLELIFDSALLRARQIRAEHPEHDYIAHLGEVERIGVRKAQYHWGWDWGPRLMTAGPWKPVRLETYIGRIEDVSIEYSLGETLQQCKGVISVQVQAYKKGDVIQVLVHDPEGLLVFESQRVVTDNGLVKFNLKLESPALWYPHGYGDQKIYQLEAVLTKSAQDVHRISRKIGFRRAELIQEQDRYGKSFYVRINGIDIFAGGSCWIPADNFLPRISRERYRKWLELMVEGNQVMTRYLISFLHPQVRILY